MSINNAHRLSITLCKGNEWDLHIYRAGFTHALTRRPESAVLSTLTHLGGRQGRGAGGGGGVRAWGWEGWWRRCGDRRGVVAREVVVTVQPEIWEQTPEIFRFSQLQRFLQTC